MIQLLQTPGPCALTKNAMIFKVKSTQLFVADKVYPKIRMNFSASFIQGFFFQFNYINPDTLSRETIRFRTVTTILEQGDVRGYSTDVGSYTLTFVEDLKKIDQLMAWYDVIFIDNGIVDLVARQAIEELIPTEVDENLSSDIFGFGYEIDDFFTDPPERDGYQMKALVYYNDPQFEPVGSEQTNTNYELIATLDVALDENAMGFLDVSEILNGKIESDMQEVLLPPYDISNLNGWNYLSPNLRQYFVVFKEFWSEEMAEFQTSSSKLFCHWGGISTDDEVINDGINHIIQSRRFLTWVPDGKSINVGQPDYLWWMNDHVEQPYELRVRIFTNIQTHFLKVLGNVMLKPFQTLGFSGQIMDYIDNPSTDHLITLEDGEVIVKYEFTIYPLYGGDYNGPALDKYTYYLVDECNKKYILYLNSFGLPETFSTQSNWTEITNISSEIASRGLAYNNSHLRSKTFLFNQQHQNSFLVESSMMKREIIRRLQPLLNSTYTFYLEGKRWIPVLIQTKKATVWNNSKFLELLEFEMLKANSSDRASFYETLPKITIEKSDYSLKFLLHLNGFDFASTESLSIYNSQGDELFSCGFDDGGFFYLNDASASDWDENAVPEGIFSYQTTITDKSGNDHILKGVFEVKYDQMSFLMKGEVLEPIIFTVASYDPTWSEVLLAYNVSKTSSGYSTIDINPSGNITTTYFTPGFKRVTLKSPSFTHVNFFESVGNPIKDLNLEAFYNLTNLNLQGAEIEGTFFLNKNTKLQNVNLVDMPVTRLEIGLLRFIEIFAIDNLELDEDGLEHLIQQFWDYRKMYSGHVDIYLVNTIAPNDETQAMIDGSGVYGGDGLADNDITVYIV